MSNIMHEKFDEFIPPPEAPIYFPTEEDWKDPLAFIAKIRPDAEQYGIVKIKPPKSWKPPFAVDEEKFTFTPRIQRLSELECRTRVKLQFLDKLAQFWVLQGIQQKLPIVKDKTLDVYKFHKVVLEHGGYEQVCLDKNWSRVSVAMGLGTAQQASLRAHYERILLPFDIMQSGATSQATKETESTEKETDAASKTVVKEMDLSGNAQLKKLKFFGAGPKATIPLTEVSEDNGEEATEKSGMGTRIRTKLSSTPQCVSCGGEERSDLMLHCEVCERVYHTFCLLTPPHGMPKRNWRCPKCLTEACNAPVAEFGFEQARKEYTLETFAEMANTFKSNYFKHTPHSKEKLVPCSTVEREFWRLLSAIDENVVVEYGADIHSKEKGSGFITDSTRDRFPDEEIYATSPWNLNNLPVLRQSVLNFISADISGMKIPWCYVGMCFSAFAWHIEDHWSYSINFLHWGEPKTWYGIPGASAEHFESVMRRDAPELFEQSPDLLHHITTTLNPNVLMANRVPVYRCDQHAGEFMITFPRAYHAGFNQGLNFAEAVNFCPADWLEKGRGCIEHYRAVHRSCVFSHEELVCTLAAEADRLDLSLAASVHSELLSLVAEEKKLRKSLLMRGLQDAVRERFELLSDDDRMCVHCKTTCFLSAVTCPCSPGKLVCSRDAAFLCSCDGKMQCLRYRYTLDELPSMLHQLRKRAESFQKWADDVKLALTSDSKVEISKLESLQEEADSQHLPRCQLLSLLGDQLEDCKRTERVLAELLKARNDSNHSSSQRARALSYEQLNELYIQVDALVCSIPGAKELKEIVDEMAQFLSDVNSSSSQDDRSADELRTLISRGKEFMCFNSQVQTLEQVLLRVLWLERASATSYADLACVQQLIDDASELPVTQRLETELARLKQLVETVNMWQGKARQVLTARPRHLLSTLELIVQELDKLPVCVPIDELRGVVLETKQWIKETDMLLTCDQLPYVDAIERQLSRGRRLPVRLESLPQLEYQVAASHGWRQRLVSTFCTQHDHVLQVLIPGASKENLMEIFGDIYAEPEKLKHPDHVIEDLLRAHEARMENVLNVRSEANGKYADGDLNGSPRCEVCLCSIRGPCIQLSKDSEFHKHAADGEGVHLRIFCSSCVPCRRPRAEVVLSLLIALQKLPVRMREAEALQSLVQSTLIWQNQVDMLMSDPEICSFVKVIDEQKGEDPVLKPETRDRAQKLLVEGDLLQMYLDQTQVLSLLLRKSDVSSGHKENIHLVSESHIVAPDSATDISRIVLNSDAPLSEQDLNQQLNGDA